MQNFFLSFISACQRWENNYVHRICPKKAQQSFLPLHQVAYPDVAPVMLLSESSIQDLSSRLENDVTVERFRPNIVISDCDAFQEV